MHVKDQANWRKSSLAHMHTAVQEQRCAECEGGAEEAEAETETMQSDMENTTHTTVQTMITN